MSSSTWKHSEKARKDEHSGQRERRRGASHMQSLCNCVEPSAKVLALRVAHSQVFDVVNNWKEDVHQLVKVPLTLRHRLCSEQFDQVPAQQPINAALLCQVQH